ncbi:MAG: hypothetical protein ACI8TQ_001819 [Planctomycetota bacterium]|jgi:hypothetical protein
MPDVLPNGPSLLEILTLNPARDNEGRALLENAADQKALDEIKASYEKCPYEDSPSRLGHEKPMNMGALEQAKRNFAGMLAVLRHLRELHLQTVGGRELVVADWRRICITGEMLPRFLFLRNHVLGGAEKSEGYYAYIVPSDVSTLFKTVRGVAKVLDYLHENASEVAGRLPKEMATRLGIPRTKAGAKKGAMRGAKKTPVEKPLTSEGMKAFRAAEWTTDDLLWVAEKFDLFVGENEVCAAPTNMVRAMLEAMIDGKNAHEELELSDHLKQLIGTDDSFVRFCDVLDDVYRDLRQFREKCTKSMQRIQAEFQSITRGQSGRAFSICMTGFDHYLIGERHFLDRCRVAQAELLQAARSSQESPALDLNFIDKLLPDNRRVFVLNRVGAHATHTDETIEVTIASEAETVTESIPYVPE